MSKIDTKALEKALKKVSANTAEIARTIQRKKDLEIEVTNYLASIDPEDEKSLLLISMRRTQLEVLPSFTQRARDKHPALMDTLFAEIGAMETALEEADTESFRVYEAELGDGRGLLTKSFCPRLPRDNEGHIGAARVGEAEGLRTQYPEQFDRAVMARAEELLTIAAEFEPYQPGTVKQKLAGLFGLKLA